MRLILVFIISVYLAFPNTALEREKLLNKYYNTNDIDEKYFDVAAQLAREYRFSDRDRAFSILDSAKIYVEDFLPNNYAGDIFNVYGNLYYDIGNISLALDNYYLCLSNAIETEQWGGASFSYSDIGYCFYSLKFYEIAKYYYEKAFLLAEKAPKKDAYYPRSHAAISLALTLGHLGELDSAYYYLDTAEKIRKISNNKNRLAQVYSYYAMISYRHENNLKKAREYFGKAIDVFSNKEELDSWREGLGHIYNYLGMIETQSGNLDKAKKYNRLSKEKFKKQSKYQIPLVDAHFAQILASEEHLDSALTIALNAEKNAIENGVTDITLNIYEIIMFIYSKSENYKETLKYKEKYEILKDSLASADHISALNTIETTLKLQEKENERAFLEKLNIIQSFGLLIILMLSIIVIYLLYNRSKLQKQNLEKIQKANKELNEANLTKDKFFSIIAHDLKNPISAFKGSLEMMSKDFDYFDKSDIKEMIEELYDSSKSMQELLNNLLTWSRAQGGKVKFNPEEINPCFLAENVKSLTKHIAKSKSIEILINCQFTKMIGDSNLINVILLNLVTNAIKFSNEKSKIFINITQKENSNLIEIKDQGVGMSKDDIDKLFNLATSFSKQGTNKESGTGLGLIVCQEFVNLHNGEIWCESELGKGTSFFIKLPK